MSKRDKERSIADDMNDYIKALKIKSHKLRQDSLEIFKHLLVQIIREEIKAELYRISARCKTQQKKKRELK